MARIVSLVLAGLLPIALVGCSTSSSDPPADRSAPADDGASPSGVAATKAPTPTPTPRATPTATPEPEPAAPAVLPDGGRKVFADGAFLVAYYGTANTGVLGVLGETGPDTMDQRLRAAARPYRRPGHPTQRVYELIVTVADGGPGDDGDFSHDIARPLVQRYVDAAHRNGALLLLDLQPGRANFLDIAKRWQWALEDPWVGLALDPEWRMGPRQVPGRSIGGVDAREINQTSAWLARLRRRLDLPEKLFVLHQFKTSMIRRIDAVQPRGGLAEVQHVDGFGDRGQKLATFGAVARPDKFTMGFKLFYDEDIHRMGPSQVHAIRPHVRFISFQ